MAVFGKCVAIGAKRKKVILADKNGAANMAEMWQLWPFFKFASIFDA